MWGRAEEQPLEAWGVAVAKALAQPPTAAEWCLPLVREGGVGRALGRARPPSRSGWPRSRDAVGGELEPSPPGLLVLRKTGPTPPGFPRRVGVAKKRPLA